MEDSSTTDKSTKTRSARKKANATEPKLEALLWAAADKLRGHMDAAEYKHVVLGLIFLKYISDAFEEHRKSLEDQFSDPANELYIDKPLDRYTTLEDRDEYTAANIFWAPQEAVLIKGTYDFDIQRKTWFWVISNVEFPPREKVQAFAVTCLNSDH